MLLVSGDVDGKRVSNAVVPWLAVLSPEDQIVAVQVRPEVSYHWRSGEARYIPYPCAKRRASAFSVSRIRKSRTKTQAQRLSPSP
jgi:hypothetical protein